MKKLIAFLFFISGNYIYGQAIDSLNQSLTYFELIKEYKILDQKYDNAALITYGKTDCGLNLQLFIISGNGIFQPQSLHELGKVILFINNGIHPGEPDGMDASLKFAKKILQDTTAKRYLENVVICIVPVLNIDGALNRNSTSRVNQNGPVEYGFRGNAKNLDLNRDFIKTDASNTHSLKAILQQWEPDVFVDTHVSDGADYQYTMTLISTQHNKLNPILGTFLHDSFTPALLNAMKDKNDEMIPYVAPLNEESSPDSGIVAFLETPRFLSGYMAAHNCFSFITESHMLKPFSERVKSMMNFLSTILAFTAENKTEILNRRKAATEYDEHLKWYPYNFEVDMTKKDSIYFNGYNAEYLPSKITGLQRLKYNHDKPFRKKIGFYNDYSAKDSVEIPNNFFVPQAYENIVRMLELNGATINRIAQDSTANCKSIYIDDYTTTSAPYEGHYLHSNVRSHSIDEKIWMKRGDYLVSTKQKSLRTIMETLMPDAVDSYFCWGFFDSILQEKEWFSSYVFEDLADLLLKKDELLAAKFTNWKKDHPKADSYSQLYFIYQNSPYFEKGFKRYPIRLLY